MATTTNLPNRASDDARLAYQQKVEAELNKLNAKISELKVKADRARADASAQYHGLMEELYAKRDAAQLKLQQLQEAGEDAWQEMQTGFEKAFNELNKAFDSAIAKFQ